MEGCNNVSGMTEAKKGKVDWITNKTDEGMSCRCRDMQRCLGGAEWNSRPRMGWQGRCRTGWWIMWREKQAREEHGRETKREPKSKSLKTMKTDKMATVPWQYVCHGKLLKLELSHFKLYHHEKFCFVFLFAHYSLGEAHTHKYEPHTSASLAWFLRSSSLAIHIQGLHALWISLIRHKGERKAKMEDRSVGERG